VRTHDVKWRGCGGRPDRKHERWAFQRGVERQAALSEETGAPEKPSVGVYRKTPREKDRIAATSTRKMAEAKDGAPPAGSAARALLSSRRSIRGLGKKGEATKGCLEGSGVGGM